MKVLTYEQQLRVLNASKAYLVNGGFVSGLCILIGCNIRYHVTGRYPIQGDIKLMIPSFNRENAIALSSKYGYKKPRLKAAYWWDEGSRKHRLAFINALITELETLNK